MCDFTTITRVDVFIGDDSLHLKDELIKIQHPWSPPVTNDKIYTEEKGQTRREKLPKIVLFRRLVGFNLCLSH